MSKTATTFRCPRTATSTAAAFSTIVHVNQLAVSKLDFPSFKSENYHIWFHMARIFFVQYDLVDMINSNKHNSMGTIFSKVHEGFV